MVLQHTFEFLKTDPDNRYSHYQALAKQVTDSAEVIAIVQAHSSVSSVPSR